MFVQIIEGQVSDAAGLHRQFDRWNDEVSKGAIGHLGATFGITADGHSITLARFASEEDARANSERPEQGAWWSETEKCYEGEVSFSESSDVTEWLGGGSNDAGFVQVMKSTGADRATVERIDERLMAYAGERPDIIGGYRAWTGPGECVEVAYFTSEAEARAGEQAGLPDELAAEMEAAQSAMGETQYIDLSEPRLS